MPSTFRCVLWLAKTPVTEKEACEGCGALVAASDGQTHRYIAASPGCWAVFEQVLAREFGDYRYAKLHRVTVDAYAAQHPGTPSPQSIQSVAVHLVGLYVYLELDEPPHRATLAIQRAASSREKFRWLEPPAKWGPGTIFDVLAAEDPAPHELAVQRWAKSVWESWSEHHAVVRQWAK